jgi:hypothetical protein
LAVREPFTIGEVISIVERAQRPHLGLLENHGGEVIKIRAWDYHAGLRYRGAIADFDFESIEVPDTLCDRMPRVALAPHTYAQYCESVRHCIRGHFPRRDSRARAEREGRLRPRARITIANSVSMNRVRANLSAKVEGYTLIDLRSIVRYLEVKVAGTPSGYPQFFVFPMNWVSGSTNVTCLPAVSVWGWHSFDENELTAVTDQGRDANPEVWYYSNILHIRHVRTADPPRARRLQQPRHRLPPTHECRAGDGSR